MNFPHLRTILQRGAKSWLIQTLFLIVSAQSLTAQIYLDSTAAIEDRVADLMSRMSLDEKIGQMTQAERSALGDGSEIASLFLGSVLSGGGSAPAANTPPAWAEMVDGFQAMALSTPLGVPILYGIDAVHGHNNVAGAVIFPHNIGMGATWDSTLVEAAARVTALEVAGTGIHWTFAPCIAVPRDERWGRTYEGFAETPGPTRSMAAAAVRGFQGDTLADRASILACAKHYLGDGGTLGGDDQGNTVISEDSLRAIHLPGYQAAITAGVRTIMASYSSWNGQKLHGHPYLLSDVLKGELGFDGFVVSDWNGIDQLPGDYSEDVRESINAGIDMVMVPFQYATFISTLRSLVQDGQVAQSRIDDAVSRILRVKFEMGLFEHPYAASSLTDSVGSATHRAVARQAVRESAVLLKKENGLLPLTRDGATILVAGSHADNLGYQCGGWSISWQGGSGDITTGTTILEGIQNNAGTSSVVYSPDGLNPPDADVAVVVIGELPYAEGAGDRNDLHLDLTDIRTLRRIKDSGIPTVVVLVSGRPMILENILPWADVLLAAWLPGTEGGGIGDLLFGDALPRGRLTHSWPRTMDQIPINWGDPEYDPLYPYGHGIQTWTDSDASLPARFQSAMLRSDGLSLELACDKDMLAPAGPDGLSLSTGESAAEILNAVLLSGDPHTLLLTLAEVPPAGEQLQLTYSPGSIQAADGSLLAAFDHEDVYDLRSESGTGNLVIPGLIQAEDWSLAFGVQTETTSDSGGGLNVGWIDTDDWMEYNLDVQAGGTFDLALRVAAASVSGQLGFSLNGVQVLTLDLPVTGGWQNWVTLNTTLNILPGPHTLRLNALMGGFNLNWLEFTLPESQGNEVLVPTQLILEAPFPNPFNAEVRWHYSQPERGAVTLKFYTITGRLLDTFELPFQAAGWHDFIWNAQGRGAGTIILQLQTGDRVASGKCVLLK